MEGLAVLGAWFEGGQKVLAGDGDDSYNAFGDMLTTATPTTYLNENNGNEYVAHGGAKISPTESSGLTSILVGGMVDTSGNDQSVLKYHADRAMSYLKLTTGGVKVCSRAIIAGAVVGALLDLASIVLAVLSAGTTTIASAAMVAIGEFGSSALMGTLTTIGLGAVAGKIANVIVPTLAKMFVTTIATDVYGEDFGNMVASLGSRYYGKGHQGNGGTAMTYDNALAYYRATQSVLAMNAELDRATRSPFDITNGNTFLGKISSQLAISSASGSASLFGGLATLGKTTNAFNMPIFISTSAADEMAFKNQLGNCPNLAGINAVGDAFCNPIRGNDLSTIESDPEDVYWKVAYTNTKDGVGGQRVLCNWALETCEQGTFSFMFDESMPEVTREEHDEAVMRGDPLAQVTCGRKDNKWKWSASRGNYCNDDDWYYGYAMVLKLGADGLEQINGTSDLGKMIRYGVNRMTDPGTMDAGILNEEMTQTPSWLGGIPILGDILQIIDEVNKQSTLDNGWVNGENFCAGCSPDRWENLKWLDQYLVDNNLYEMMGAIAESPAVGYYKTEVMPTLDMSYEGRLAANMGMPKEWVVSTLAFANDLINAPRDVDSLISSAPNIFYSISSATMIEDMTIVTPIVKSCEELTYAQNCTQIATSELRRRFNVETVA
jgi:hypothetical protein